MSELLGLLRDAVGEETLREGVESYRRGCVTEVERCGDELVGFVEDGSMWDVERTEVQVLAGGELVGACTCASVDGPCHHMVATLLKAENGIDLAGIIRAGVAAGRRARALAAVRRAGKCEVAVDPLATTDEGYGVWKAQTMAKHRPSTRIHRVELFSRARRANQCTCRAFEYDELGTCRHIEAVLDVVGSTEGEPPRTVVYVDWDSGRPKVCVFWSSTHRNDPPRRMAQMFDADGVLTCSLEQGVERMRQIESRGGGPKIGADVVQLLQRERAPRERSERRVAARDAMRRLGESSAFFGTLRPFQQTGVEFLVENGRAILADEMGLGKTVQAIAAADWLRELDGVQRVLVVCPTSIKQQWADEIRRFTDHEVTVASGSRRRRRERYRQAPGFLVINYALLRRDAVAVQRTYDPDLLIVDEAQRIKNRDTLTAEAVKSFSTRFCFLLTGTPIENRATDLFSLMEPVDPTVLGPSWRFKKVTPTEIHTATARHILRRRRSILDAALPKRMVDERVVKISREQLDYQRGQVMAASKLAEGAEEEGREMTPGEHAMFMGHLNKARMASNSMFLIDGETRHAPKVDVLMQLVDELHGRQDRKIVVFSEWLRSVELARDALNERGLRSVFLHGGVPTAGRADLIRQFADDPSIAVLFSTQAGGVGLNLQMASAVINMELPWNPAKLDQRIARVHRLGQTRDVTVVNLVGTGYEKMRLQPLLQQKRELARAALEPNAPAASPRPRRSRDLGYSALDETGSGG